jgi:hypothetical protein
MPCPAPNEVPLPLELGGPSWPDCEPAVDAAVSPAGNGLLRPSTSAVCDEEGVPAGEFEAAWEGEEVPEVESFFLDDFSLVLRDN